MVHMSSGSAEPGRAIEAHPLHFSGTGGGYARVWLVNLLLNALTLGLYTPWARRRTAVYFYDHTEVANSPLEFVAQQKRMVLGFLMLVGLYLAFQIASDTGQDLTVALLMFAAAALAPWLWGSAMRFRLGNTRWRGLRLQFRASWREIYLASWPVFALALIWAAVVVAALGSHDPDIPNWRPPGWLWGAIAAALVGSVLCVIRLEYNYQRLLVRQAFLGEQAGRWKPVYGDFVRIWLATVGVFILCLVLALVLVGLGFGGALYAAVALKSGMGAWLAILGVIVAGLALVVVASAPARAYREARMFQLVWNQVGVSQIARFKSHLNTRRFIVLRMKNMLLTLLTLGFYRPFALVSEYRMKVDSVTLYVKGGLDQVVGQLQAAPGHGLGDAAADALGLDLIG